MIYTVTMNPAIDYIVDVKNFKTGITNRTIDEMLLPGGKGINVSKVLANMGIDTVALGFIAGHVGGMLHDVMEREGVIDDFTEIEGETRINVKIRNLEGTEINGQGPLVGAKEVSALKDRLMRLSFGDILVLGGRLPNGVDNNIYEEIMEGLRERQVQVVLDTSGESLRKALHCRPFLIKPNRMEVEEIFGDKIYNPKEAVEYAKRLQSLGARNVIISLDSQGAVMADEFSNIYVADAPKVRYINYVGAGDAMVAGFLAGYIGFGMTMKQSFLFAICTASASVGSMKYVTKKDAFDLYNTYRLMY